MINTEHIIKLLQQHQQVIIPNFGAFVVTNQSAKVSIIDKHICPPHLIISFDNSQINNDTLLTDYMDNFAVKLGISSSLAIQQQVLIWNTQLHRGENIKLKNLGTLNFDVDKNIQFKPIDIFLNSALYFGLQNIYLQPILRLDEKESIIKDLVQDNKNLPIENAKKDVSKPISKTFRNWWIAASAIVVLCLSAVGGMFCMDDKYCAMNVSNFISFNWASDFIEFVQKLL
jgi:nucleoid DNA-binding protein